MRTIIKITKQEAIDAWKLRNKNLLLGENTTVEIEDNFVATTFPITTVPTYGTAGTGGTSGTVFV